MSLVYPNEVFFDDTGCNKEPVFMWCGYLANMHYWVQFAEKWRAALDEPPALPYWHQTKARVRPREKRAPPFDALTDTELDEKEEKLANLVGWVDPSGGEGCVGIVVRLPHAYHRDLVQGKIPVCHGYPQDFRKWAGTDTLERQHRIAFDPAAILALHIVRKWGIGSPINYIYEDRENDPYQIDVLESFHAFRASPHPAAKSLGDLIFASSKSEKHLPLQAADMLAWHQGYRSRRRGQDDPMWRYIARKPINTICLGMKELTEWVDRYNDPKYVNAFVEACEAWKRDPDSRPSARTP